MSVFPAANRGFFAIIEEAFDGIAVWEAQPWRLAYANPVFLQQFGRTATLSTSDSPAASWGPELIGLFERIEEGPTDGVVSARLDLGSCRDAEVRLCRLEVEGRRMIGMIVRGSRAANETKTDDSLRRDPLTGLRDREFLLGQLASLLSGNRSADRQFAVLFLDLDNFKQVNDEYGHLIGDRVLQVAAGRIASCLREGDHVVRFGGDEFVALLSDVTTAAEVEPAIRRIQTALSTPIALPDGDVRLTLSVGVALGSDGHASAEALLAAADRAMYADKREA